MTSSDLECALNIRVHGRLYYGEHHDGMIGGVLYTTLSIHGIVQTRGAKVDKPQSATGRELEQAIRRCP